MGRRFTGVLGRLGIPTGDRRIISPGGLISRDLPLPMAWQRESSDGHSGSVVVGRIEELTFHQDMVTYSGHMLDVSGSWEAEELIEAGVIGPSMDLDDMTYVVDDDGLVIITSARIAGATLVAIPAFAEVSINLDPRPVPEMEPDRIESAADLEWVGSYALTASVDVSRETLPPLQWFARPEFDGPTPLTVTDEGQVFGHIAPWGECHVGLPGCTTAPPSYTNYAHFLRKDQMTREGTSVPTGIITVGGGHPDPALGMIPAMGHYDNPDWAVAKVFAGEDEFGIWVAGWILPYADPVKVQQLKDIDVSGDWRHAGGNLELMGLAAVVEPGFPVLRKVHFSLEKGGQQTLIGQFKVTAGTVETDDVSRETSADDARARWAWASRSFGSPDGELIMDDYDNCRDPECPGPDHQHIGV